MFDNDGRSALHLAAECGSMEVDTAFIFLFSTLSRLNFVAFSAPSKPSGNDGQVCKSLLDKNAFVNSKTKLGWTALHFAASKVPLMPGKNTKWMYSAGLHRPG